jgi:hypothetical protein
LELFNNSHNLTHKSNLRGNNCFIKKLGRTGKYREHKKMFVFESLLFIFFVTSFATAQYAQLSSSKNVVLGALGTGTTLTYDMEDALDQIAWSNISNPGELTIAIAGTYFVVAAPQVGCNGCNLFVRKFVADFWIALNGQPVPNSNVRLTGKAATKDVIVTQGLVNCAAGQKISIKGSGTNARTEAIRQAPEPLIPSIILTVFKIA